MTFSASFGKYVFEKLKNTENPGSNPGSRVARVEGQGHFFLARVVPFRYAKYAFSPTLIPPQKDHSR